jgi:hypothetical protein
MRFPSLTTTELTSSESEPAEGFGAALVDCQQLPEITEKELGKREIGLLSAGDWPGWNQIVENVPEFDGILVAFDALCRLEWFRHRDMCLQYVWICVECGIYYGRSPLPGSEHEAAYWRHAIL